MLVWLRLNWFSDKRKPFYSWLRILSLEGDFVLSEATEHLSWNYW